MRITMSAVLLTAMATALLIATGSLAVISVASAGAPEPSDVRTRVVSDFCNQYPGASSCRDWQENQQHWSETQYQNFYRKHQYEYIMNTAEAAAAFGVTTRTMSGSQRTRGLGVVSDHIYDCRGTFASYDAHTDTYVAYDGTRQKCDL